VEIIAGKYEVQRELGSGGHGKVYLCLHRDLRVSYAVKVMSQIYTQDPKFVDRFRREAEALARLNDPGIAQLRDFGRSEDGSYYMAIEFVEGELLSSVIEREQWLPVKRSINIALQVLRALTAAHHKGVVHRDIKPANIMLVRDANGDECVKILDFGIAKIHEATTDAANVTREGLTVGTPQYMSPEQASGQSDLDHRVDIYSVGIVLFEMLTGSVPFNGDTVLQVLLKHLTQPPPPFAERLGVPKAVETLVLKALTKDRAQRFQSAKAFAEECNDLLGEIEIQTFASGAISMPSTSKEAEQENIESSSAGHTKILCLDDNEMILNITRHILERDGYDVFTATDFSVIHDYIFREKVDLMLCDVEMPGLPGGTICRMLKKSIPELKIYLFSNLPERELEKISTASAADGWISKNEKPEVWLTTVKQALNPKDGGG
jgi:serine/threonine protein kinase